MIVWAVAPANEPATNLSWTLSVPPSLVPRINHFIYRYDRIWHVRGCLPISSDQLTKVLLCKAYTVGLKSLWILNAKIWPKHCQIFGHVLKVDKDNTDKNMWTFGWIFGEFPLTQSPYNISVGLGLFGLYKTFPLFFFNHSFWEQLVCLGSLSCYMIFLFSVKITDGFWDHRHFV